VLEEIHRQPGGGTEASSLHEDRALVEHLGGLHHLACRGEHRRIRQPLLDELQAHETVVHLAESRAGEHDHIDLDALAGEIVHQRADQGGDLAVMRGRSIDEFASEDPQCLLLARGESSK